ncbi:hypothetical protein KJ975_05095 [Myxococcota bacterium]|nr:hypothetical protein [Myxococcota bacterium]
MTIFLLLISLVTAEPEFSCRWGEKSDLQPLPDCGVPVRVRIKFPEESRGRFEFRRLENPGLTGYFHQKRDGQGSPKPFNNLVNLFKVDLFFCPTDFVTPRTLLFHHVGIPAAKEYQCQLGAYSEGDAGADPPAMAGKPQPGPSMAAEGATEMGVGAEMGPNNAGVGPGDPPRDAVTGLIPPPQVTTTGQDAFARNLAAAALAVGVLSLLLWAVFAVRVSRSLRRRREEDAPVIELTKADRKSDEEN